jgi:general secretion pathway protein L
MAKLRRRTQIEQRSAAMMKNAARLMSPLEGALRWWFRELRACVPGSRLRTSPTRSRALIVRMFDEAVVFHHRKGRGEVELGRISIDAAESSFAQQLLATARRTARSWRTVVVLYLRPESVLRLRVAFPLAAQENLEEVLGFEMERLTAFKASEVYYSHRVVDVNQAEKRMTVQLMAVPRVIADAAIELVRKWGLRADLVTADKGDLATDPAMNLLPRPVPARSDVGMGRILVALIAIAIGLAATQVHLEFRQQARLLAAYEARLAESRGAALRVEKLRMEVSQLLARTRYVAQRKQAQPLVSEMLSEVTQRLPDDTWVSQFQMKRDHITLSGYSASASALIEGLEASEMLSQVRFTSPITLDSRFGVERFNLAAGIASNGDRP